MEKCILVTNGRIELFTVDIFQLIFNHISLHGKKQNLMVPKGSWVLYYVTFFSSGAIRIVRQGM
jgi:hypothetical protein